MWPISVKIYEHSLNVLDTPRIYWSYQRCRNMQTCSPRLYFVTNVIQPIFESIFHEALEEAERCTYVNGIWIRSYADDIFLATENILNLQATVDRVNTNSKNMNLSNNIDKTKFTVVTRNSDVFSKNLIPIDNLVIKQINKFKYLRIKRYEPKFSGNLQPK